MTREEFIEKAKIVHKCENIDYSQVVYKNNRTKVKLIDPVYGEFWQTPYNHLKGQSHPKRKGEKISYKKSSKQDEVIERFKEKHNGEGLDYSKVNYVNMHTKVCIIDPVYGEFWQEPVVHLKGCVHPRRAIDKNAEKQRYTTESFNEICKKIHPDYDLSKVHYKSSQTKVIVICPKHGEFLAYPDALLVGKGCPKCGNHLSKAEDEMYEILCERIGKENVIKGDKKTLNGKEIDILIPSKNTGIEFDGLRWHSEQFKQNKVYHLEKTELCRSKGISLIHVFEDEWDTCKEIVIEKILNSIGENDGIKISGRKCTCRAIDKETSEGFLEYNHIQGFTSSTVYLGCFYENEIIAVMTFKKISEGMYELNRFAAKRGYICRGVGGKLFSYFVKNYNPNYVKSFADRRWTLDANNNLYTKLGFKLDEIESPDYSYTNGHGVRLHKFGFRKKVLNKKYGFPLSMTEYEMSKELGYYRIWNCGLFKYVWKKDGD